MCGERWRFALPLPRLDEDLAEPVEQLPQGIIEGDIQDKASRSHCLVQAVGGPGEVKSVEHVSVDERHDVVQFIRLWHAGHAESVL